MAKKSGLKTNTISPSDLAWIVQGVVIGQGFLSLTETKNFTGFICLSLILIFSLIDWHLFYKFYKRLNSYSVILWIWDYLLIALLASAINKAIQPDLKFFVISYFWLYGTLAWWCFGPPKYGISHRLLCRYIRKVVKWRIKNNRIFR